MGELVAGTPALRLSTAVLLPLDLVSFLSLLYRAVPGSELDPWLVSTRRALPTALREDLDLLHGFSGRLLYYVEEPVMRFEPLRPDRLDAGFADLLEFLQGLPPADYRAMAAHALARVHRDLGLDLPSLTGEDETAWRRALEPALTTANADAVWSLIASPERLKQRTLDLFSGVWEQVYRREFERHRGELEAAADAGVQRVDRGFGLAFADLTGNRPPAPLVARLGEVDRVAFCPSAHLGTFVSYILYPPDLVVFFGAPEFLARAPAAADGGPPHEAATEPASVLSNASLVDAFRALADPTRLRIVDLLGADELYAQEIVGRLGLAQSAVSRHLAQLERAGVVGVRASRGMKYYAINADRVVAIAEALRTRAGSGSDAAGGSAAQAGS